MDIHITTRKGSLTDQEHELAIESAKNFQKFHSSIVRVDAIIDEEPINKSCEYTVRIHGQLIVAKERGPDFSKAIHDAAQKVQRQLSKIHDKAAKHQ